MRLFLLALLWPALPVCAQFRSIVVTFEGIGCASCIESMPARMQRFRGVESATVDAEKGTLTIKLAAANRVRLEQVRDAIQQDGTKVRKARVEAAGVIAKEGGAWTLRLEGPPATSYTLEGKALQEGPATVTADVPSLEGKPVLHAVEVRPR